jgi:hypothetical protein
MVHIVVMTGPGLGEAVSLVPAISQGWIQVQLGVWLVASALDAQQFRDYFQALDVQMVVVRLYGNWGTKGAGLAQVANWLKGARNAF